MDVRQHHITNIQQRLSYLKSRVEIAGSLNLTDVHIYAEDFYQDLFNILDYNLKNGNIDQQNCAFIDLIDETNKTAIQVTSRNDKDKITDTIKGFFSDPKYKNYSLKVLLISKQAKEYRTDFSFEGKYNFDHKTDVIDIQRLIQIIKEKGRNKIIEVSKFLDREIDLPRPKTESNEVETIMSLLNYLSDDTNFKDFDNDYICDPQLKIDSKFKEFADDFKDDYMDLYPIYCNIIPEAKKTFGLDGVRAVKISNFLKIISNKFLREQNGNALIAMDKLVDFFERKLNNNGILVDNVAIRFYLLEELIGCNIFALKMD